MASSESDQLRDYLTLITKKRGGLDPIISMLEERAKTGVNSGLEKISGQNDSLKLAVSGLQAMEIGREPSQGEVFGMEAIILADLRPAIDIVDGKFLVTHPLWVQLSEDAVIRARIESVIPSVGRIELPGNDRYPYGGTGFVVGDGLLMTNRHVAEIFAQGLGDKRLSFLNGAKAGIDFKREQGRPTGPTLDVTRVVMIHPYWDMAILAVDGLPDTITPLKLSSDDARDLAGRDIFVIGYPTFDPRNPANVQGDVMAGKYGVKRLQPGELQGGINASSFGKMVPAATHDCSTLGGNSGSPIFDLASGEVLGLHFGGLYQKRNYAVPASDLGRDSRVIATRIHFAYEPKGGENGWSAWWARADATESPSAVIEKSDAGADPGLTSVAAVKGRQLTRIVVPLHITISVEVMGPDETSMAAKEPHEIAEIESTREPFRDADFSSRRGYDPGFLNDPKQDKSLAPVEIPMPSPVNPGALAKTRSGDHVLHYENFSIMMHAQRRLALITASNVTKTPELRKPESNRDYTRRGLSGLGENDQERWFIDPRLNEMFQIPDVFFTKDRKSFDKGHIVRRDDVAWGETYERLRRANGDTYHVTNCSPQTAGFNRSATGDENWGDLENCVLSEAANERLCVFAGPVLDPSDEVFTGVGDGGAVLRAKIPSRYWKVIVTRVDDGIAAYGFVLEQDLSDVEFEFAVPAEFVPAMYPISDIGLMSGVVFESTIRGADQYETVRGANVRLRTGVRRKREGKK